MARQARQVSGVYEKNRGSGIWYIRYRIKGKLVRRRIGTRQQAIEALDKVRFVRASGSGVVPSSAKLPVQTFAEQEVAEQAAAESVLLGQLCDGLLKQIQGDPERYRDQLNPPQRIGRIKDAFGTRPASSIRPYEIADWLAALAGSSGERLAAATRNRYKAVFSAIYSYGKERELVSVNPAREAKKAKEAGGVIRYLDPEEEARLRKVLQNDVDACPSLQPVRRKHLLHRIYEIDVALGTGVRKGEQYKMRWPEVNFDRREIVIPKTKFGPARTVYMIDDVISAMQELRKMPLARRSRSKDKPNQTPSDSVFSLGDNKKWFTSALRRAGIKKFRWHDLRHTFCSRLVQRGVNLKIVQEAAGHRTIAMTVRYAHLDKTNLANAMDLLNRKPAKQQKSAK